MIQIIPSDENLNFRLETQGGSEKAIFTDTRLAKKNNFLGYHQRMPTNQTLDTDLRKYFGFGKKQLKNIVKKPGVKFGFKLSNYIHSSDSVETVNKVLLEIAQHIEYIKSSPVKKLFNEKFKEELRAKFFERNPKQYLIKLSYIKVNNN